MNIDCNSGIQIGPQMPFLSTNRQCQSSEGNKGSKLYSAATTTSILMVVFLVKCSDAGVVMCLGHGADLHKAQLMPLPLTVACFSKADWFYLPGFTSLVLTHQVVPDKIQEGRIMAVCVCVCVPSEPVLAGSVSVLLHLLRYRTFTNWKPANNRKVDLQKYIPTVYSTTTNHAVTSNNLKKVSNESQNTSLCLKTKGTISQRFMTQNNLF